MEFLKNNKRFSFKLGGMNAWDSDYKSEVTAIGNEVTTVYLFDGGIKITKPARLPTTVSPSQWPSSVL